MSRRLLALLCTAALVACESSRDRRAAASAASEEAPTEEIAAGVSRMSGGTLSAYDTLNRGGPTHPKGEGFVQTRPGLVWYKVSGAERSGIPVILIHDGPGGSSFALKSLEALSDERPVVRYDQMGGGRSEAVVKAFSIPYYLSEIDSLRRVLKYDKVHLLGHSWGAVLALEYYKAHPEAVASLVLESPEIDFPALSASIKKRIKELPDSMRVLLDAQPKFGTTARTDYQVALLEFIKRNVCCRKYNPADLDSISRSQNDTVYAVLRGSNEVNISGVLAGYSATDILKTAKVPVLFTVGENDVADPPTVQRFASMTPNARFEVLKGVMHFPTWEAPEENTRIVREFLRQAEGATPRR